jgi:glycine dehydrogenase
MSLNIHYQENFKDRHIAPNTQDTNAMLNTIGVKSVDELIEQTVPQSIRLNLRLITWLH